MRILLPIAIILSGCAAHAQFLSVEKSGWFNIEQNAPRQIKGFYYCTAEKINAPMCFRAKMVDWGGALSKFD